MSVSSIPEVGRNREHYWTRFLRFLRELDEASGRSEADDLLDRIVALERRVDDLSADRSPPRRGQKATGEG
jgi:hypothetical protein